MKKIFSFFLTLFLLSACSQQHASVAPSKTSLANLDPQNGQLTSSDNKLLSKKNVKKSKLEIFKTPLTQTPNCNGSEFISPVKKHEQLCRLLMCSDNSNLTLDADILLPELVFEDFIFKTVSTENDLIDKLTLDCSAVFDESALSAFVFNVQTDNQPTRVARSMSQAKFDTKYVGDGILSNLRIKSLIQSNKVFGDVRFSRLARFR
jgi:hypothetical protein